MINVAYQLPQMNKGCIRCPDLVKSRKRITFGYGDPHSPVVLIGEAPGRFGCDVTGIPFTRDKSGEFYQDMIKGIGWTKEAIYTTNIVKCCPSNALGNRKPTTEEIQNCIMYLHYELATIDPKVVVLMGDVPIKIFVPSATSVINIWDKQYTIDGRIYIVLPHPAYICRNMRYKDLYWESFKKIRSIVSG